MPSGLHPVDPDKEAARLIEERNKPRDGSWYILLGEIHQLPGGGSILVQVSADRHAGLPAGLGARLAEVVREAWPS